MEADLAVQGVRVLIAETSGLPEFGRARGFYGRCGFRQEAVIHDFHRTGEDKVVFWKAAARPAAQSAA